MERDELETRLEVLLSPGVMREHEDVIDAAAALAHGTALAFINPAASRSAHSFLDLAHKAIRDTKTPTGSEKDTSNITNLIAIATSPGQAVPTVVATTTRTPPALDRRTILDQIFEEESAATVPAIPAESTGE